MQLEVLLYKGKSGWSVSPFPALDSPETLVVVFGSTEFLDDPAPIAELGRAYPSSQFIGCSSSGEIFGTKVSDGTLSVAVAKLEHTQVRTATASVTEAKESFAAGQALAKKLCEGATALRSVF